MDEARYHAMRVLLYDTCLPAEAILGAFAILNKAKTPVRGLSPRYQLDDLLAAAFVAYKVYTTNCMPTRTDFMRNVLPELLPCVQSIDLETAELRMLESVSWTVPATTRYDCVLALLCQLAPHDVATLCATDCTICTGVVEQPTKLPCGHVCCRGCIATMSCHGFGRRQACPACCGTMAKDEYAHYATVRTMMPLKLEIDRALGYSVLAPHIPDDGLFARAVLWAAAHMAYERKMPVWVPKLFDEEYTKRAVALAGLSISTAYDRGVPGTLVAPLLSHANKRKLSDAFLCDEPVPCE